MTRRKVDPDTLDLFGFDPVGHGYSVTPDESRALLGYGPLVLALYHVLKRFAKGNGQVVAASYYRLLQVLMHRRSGPGRRPADPTLKEVRGALDSLVVCGLVFKPEASNEQRGILQIWVSSGVGGTATDSIRAGYRAGSNRPTSRASA